MNMTKYIEHDTCLSNIRSLFSVTILNHNVQPFYVYQLWMWNDWLWNKSQLFYF